MLSCIRNGIQSGTGNRLYGRSQPVCICFRNNVDITAYPFHTFKAVLINASGLSYPLVPVQWRSSGCFKLRTCIRCPFEIIPAFKVLNCNHPFQKSTHKTKGAAQLRQLPISILQLRSTIRCPHHRNHNRSHHSHRSHSHNHHRPFRYPAYRRTDLRGFRYWRSDFQ